MQKQIGMFSFFAFLALLALTPPAPFLLTMARMCSNTNSPESPRTRIGKIARLPKDVREQLNRRLQDGEPTQRLLDWLNALPKIQGILAAQFGGRPIIKQNLSEWRRGGYLDWEAAEERRMRVDRLIERVIQSNLQPQLFGTEAGQTEPNPVKPGQT